MTDAIPHRHPGRLRFIVPDDPRPIARALVDRFAYIDACPLMDPDVPRLTAWLKERAHHPVEAIFDADDAQEDLEVCMEALASGGTFALGDWPATGDAGIRSPGGYVVCTTDGILWRPLRRHDVDPNDTSSLMRLAGLPDAAIGMAQALIGQLVLFR